jgi:hypothetical protein
MIKLDDSHANTSAGSANHEGAYWLELPDGGLALMVNEEIRAEVDFAFNYGEILGWDGNRSPSFVLPFSENILEIIEDSLGIAPVNDFRTHAGPGTTDWRALAQKRAEGEYPHPLAAKLYCAEALHVLDAKSPHDSMHPALQARNNLQQARVLIAKSDYNYSPLAHLRLAQAKEFLAPKALTESKEQLFTRVMCEKALAVLERQRSLEQPLAVSADKFALQDPAPEAVTSRSQPSGLLSGEGRLSHQIDGQARPVVNLSASDQTSPLSATPDACWMELGFDRYRLVVDGQERATAYARLKTAAIPDPDTHRRETIVALDSETIFEAVEKRVGLPRVTAFTPEDRLQDRIELEKDASTFREMCAPREEPQFYVWDAMNYLFAETAGRSGSDFETARGHLGKALEALKEGDDLAEAAKQVDHARQYLPSLTDSPLDFKPHIFNALANCDRASQAIERNGSLERRGAEISHDHSAGPPRGRGRH